MTEPYIFLFGVRKYNFWEEVRKTADRVPEWCRETVDATISQRREQLGASSSANQLNDVIAYECVSLLQGVESHSIWTLPAPVFAQNRVYNTDRLEDAVRFAKSQDSSLVIRPHFDLEPMIVHPLDKNYEIAQLPHSSFDVIKVVQPTEPSPGIQALRLGEIPISPRDLEFYRN